MRGKKYDKVFLTITALLVFFGFFIFASASLGLLAREGGTLSSVIFNQIFFGLVLGGLALFVCARVIPYSFWNKYAFYIFLGSILFTALVFIPGLGFSHGGATRWLKLGPFTFQPAEILKLGFVIYFAAWLSGIRQKIHKLSFGIVPLVIFIGVIGALLLLQPDTGTFLVIATAALGMFVAADAKWSHTFALIALTILAVFVLALFKPYIKDRLLTFINPAHDPQGSSYQLQQSLIAVGSGDWTGRGFGQSVQKFKFLPEPVGDSIFAVFAEEWGFVGAVILIMLFLTFALRGMRIAARSPNTFTRLLVIGIVLLIVGQSFINIGSMIGVFPLTGVPLIFVSQGGSALLVALASVGIILNISAHQKKIS